MKYLYESIRIRPGDPVKHFEIEQGAYDSPLALHPETREPIRRVILGGWGAVKPAPGKASSNNSDCGCGPAGCC